MEQPILIYDIESCPQNCGMGMEDIIRLFKEEGIVFYSSSTDTGHRPDKPQVISVGEIEVEFVDVSKQEGMKRLNGYREKLK